MSRIAHGPSVLDRRNPIGAPPGQADDSYLAKVVKLIPAEVVATYTAIFNLIATLPEAWHGKSYWINLIFFWAATPVVLMIAGKKEGKAPGGLHLTISTIAFGVWAYAISGKIVVGEPIFQSALAGIVLILFTFISGLVSLP